MKYSGLLAAAVLVSLSAGAFAAEADFDRSVGDVQDIVDALKGPPQGGFQPGHNDHGGGQQPGFGDHDGGQQHPGFDGHDGDHQHPGFDNHDGDHQHAGFDNHDGDHHSDHGWDDHGGHNPPPVPQPQPWHPQPGPWHPQPGPGHDDHFGPQPHPWHPQPQPWHPQPEPWYPQPEPQPEPSPVTPAPVSDISFQSSGKIGGALYLTCADARADYYKGSKIDVTVEAMPIPGGNISPQDMLNGSITVQGSYDVDSLYSIRLADNPKPGSYMLTIKYTRRSQGSSGAEESTVALLNIQ